MSEELEGGRAGEGKGKGGSVRHYRSIEEVYILMSLSYVQKV